MTAGPESVGARRRWLLLALVAWSCSSDDKGPLGSGQSGAGGGVSSLASGGATSVATGGASPAGGTGNAGGASTSAGGASTSAGGASTSAGGTHPAPSGGNAGVAPIGGSSGASPDGGPDASPQPVGDWGPGDYPPDIQAQTYLEITGVKGQGSYTRQYKVHVPPGYDPTVPTPLVFCIHGLAQNPVMFCVAGAGMNTKSDQAGFILVMPNGYQASWNAGTCCGAASTEKLDDVALFRAIFAAVNQHLNVDPRRVYATGLSNGGYMSYRLACDAADLVAAIAPGAAAIGINTIGGGTNPASDFTTCSPSEPVSVLDIHGTADGLIPYSLQAPSLTLISGKNDCGTATAPASAPNSEKDTTCVSYSGCPSGTEVIGCSIAGGGHCWFGSPDCGTGGGPIGAIVVGANSNAMVNNDAVWDFFTRSAK